MATSEHFSGSGFGKLAASGTPVLEKTTLATPIVVYLLAVVIPIHFRAGPLLMTSVRLVIILMLIPILINLFKGRLGRVIATDYLFILHVCWMAVALQANNPTMVVGQIGSLGLEFIGGYFLARAYIRSAEDFIAFTKFFMVLVLCTLPFALYEAVTTNPILLQTIRKLPGIITEAVAYIDGRMGLDRAQVSFAHPIHYGLFCSGALSLTLIGLTNQVSLMTRLICASIVGACVFLSLSSGALLSAVMQGFLIAWAWVFTGVKSRWLILLGLVAVTYVAIDVMSNRTPIKVFFSYATFSAHNAYWRGIIFEWGIKNVWANPVLGLGLNDWVRPWFMFSGSMDNFWLVIAVRYGIPGFLLLAVGYGIAFFRIMFVNLDNAPAARNIRLAWIITFIGLTFTLSTVHVWSSVFSFVFFLFGSGIWLITTEQSETGAQTAPTGPPGRGPGALRRDNPAERYARPPDATSETAPPGAEPTAGRGNPDPREMRLTRFPDSQPRHTRSHPADTGRTDTSKRVSRRPDHARKPVNRSE